MPWRVFVIWQPVLPTDWSAASTAALRRVSDLRATHFWDKDRLVSHSIRDLFMSLIHTCQLCGANSFDYLVELQWHARELAANPAEWMPLSYRETLGNDPEVR